MGVKYLKKRQSMLHDEEELLLLSNTQMPLKSCKGSASSRFRKVVGFISLSK